MDSSTARRKLLLPGHRAVSFRRAPPVWDPQSNLTLAGRCPYTVSERLTSRTGGHYLVRWNS